MAKPTKSTASSPPDRVTAYALAVTSGKEVAGPLVRLACKRHLDDLKNGHKRGLKFDLEAAEKAFKFFEKVLKVAGKGEFVDFILHPSQAFIVGSLYGWKIWQGERDKRGRMKPGAGKWLRRFRTGYVEQGKGNGKSPLAAGIGMKAFVADGELGAEVYVAATYKDQAMIAFRDAVKMYEQSPELQKRLGKSGANPVWQLYHVPSGSFMKPLSKEGAHSGPRPNCALIDEYHEHKSADMLEMLEAGFKGRENPLLFIITNSGSDKKTACGEMHDYCTRIVKGELDGIDQLAADQTFVYICALDVGDDPLKDESCWPKANPLLGVTIKRDYLAKQVAAARSMPSKQNKVLRLNFCVWTDAADAWITRELWEAVESPAVTWDSMKGRDCYVGLDLSFTTDMSAAAFVFPKFEGKNEDGESVFSYDAFLKYWRPREGLKEASDRDRVRYDLWEKSGDIDTTAGQVIKLAPIAQSLAKAQTDFRLKAVLYDRYRHKELDDNIADLGFTLPMMEHPQGFRRMTTTNPNDPKQKIDNPLWMPNSVQEFENAIVETRLRVAINPALRWNVSSAVIREDPAGTDNHIFDKRRATGRIDGIVALAMGIGGAKYVGTWKPPGSPWEDPDFSIMKTSAANG